MVEYGYNLYKESDRMGTVKNAIYKVDNGVDFDEIHFRTKASQVVCDDGKILEVKLEEKANKGVIKISPTLLNGWKTLSGYEPLIYYKDDFGIVHIQGVVTLGTGTYIFKLPEGFRPSLQTLLNVTSLNNDNKWGATQVSIKETGDVNIINGITGKTHCFDVSFVAN